MLGGRRPQQIAVEPRSGLEQVGQGQLGAQAELEGDIAELDVEVDQAGFALASGLACSANRIASWLTAPSRRPRRRS